MSKTKYVAEININELKKQVRTMLENKYFMVWMNHYEFSGLDRKQKRFIMKQYWNEGKVMCGQEDHSKMLWFTDFFTSKYDYMKEPSVVRPVPFMPVPFINTGKDYVVDKDCAIGWANSTRNSIRSIVRYFIDRMVNLEIVLNTNICLQNMPFFMTITPESKMKAQDIINKLLNGEPVIVGDAETLNAIQSITTNTPYICDKLRSIYYDFENQLYTILGIDNTKMDGSNKQFVLTEQLDANIAEVNAFANDFDTTIQEFIDDINAVFGTNITVKSTIAKADSLYSPGEEFKQPGRTDDKEGGKADEQDD